MFIQKKRIVAEDEIQQEEVTTEEVQQEEAVVEVPEEATDLLFEAEDVAQLLAEATGEAVEVTVEDNYVEFAVGDQVLTAEADGDEEILEASTKVLASKNRNVSAATRRRHITMKR